VVEQRWYSRNGADMAGNRSLKHFSTDSEYAFVARVRRNERGDGKKSKKYPEGLSRFFAEPQPFLRSRSRNDALQQAPWVIRS
jgi:hypothetical protein